MSYEQRSYLISYDIRASNSRTKALKTLRKLSVNYQRSVFECQLSSTQLLALVEYLQACIDVDDRLLITRLKTTQPHWTLGNQQPIQALGCLIVF
jgi:CRISPR-associated endonuclease Cas2